MVCTYTTLITLTCNFSQVYMKYTCMYMCVSIRGLKDGHSYIQRSLYELKLSR